MHHLTRLSLAHPFAVAALILAITAGFASRLPTLMSEVGYRAYLGADHPTVIELDRFIQDFGGGFPVAAAWSCEETPRCQTVFDTASLEMADGVVETLRSRKEIRRIDSVATTPVLEVRGGALATRVLFEGGAPAPDLERLQSLALRDPMLQGRLVSEDGKVGAIVLELASSEMSANRAAVLALEEALAPYEEAGFRFHIFGQAAQFVQVNRELSADAHEFTPLAALIVVIVVFALFRSWQSVASALVTLGASTLWTMGLLALLRWPQNAQTQAIPSLVIVVSVCDSIHILARYTVECAAAKGRSRAERVVALLRACRDVGPACFATTATTAVAFLSFTTSGLESQVRFGIVVAFGIAAALVLSFTLLPLLLIGFPPDRTAAGEASALWDRGLHALIAGIRRWARPILAGSLILGVISAYGLANLRVDSDEYKLYSEESVAVRTFRFVGTHLQKPDTLEIELTIPSGRELHDPEVLNRIESLERALASIDGLGRSRSLLDAMTLTNRLLHEDDPAYERPGRSAAENRELLRLLSLRDPGRLEPWINPDFRRLRISVEADKRPSSERSEILAQVRGALSETLSPEWESRLTGPFAVYYDMAREIQRSQLSSFGVAAAAVFLVLAGFLLHRSGSVVAAFGWACVGMFPTVLPVLVTLGVMGYAGIYLDVGTGLVGAIVLGIAIDDSIHLLAEFHKHRRAGLGPSASIEGAILRVGRAVITTSVALSLGFFMVIVSSWQSVSSFGFLSGIAILSALAADLWLLPALILTVTRQRGNEKLTQIDRPAFEGGVAYSRRLLVSLLVLLPIAAATVLAGQGVMKEGSRRELACRTLPSGVVPLIAGSDARCTLRPLDRVIAIELDEEVVSGSSRSEFLEAVARSPSPARLRVERSGSRRQIEVPILEERRVDRLRHFLVATGAALGLLGFSLRVYWQSLAAASSALLMLCAAVGIQLIAILCHARGDALAWVSVPATPFIPAALAHLALTFPKERRLIRAVPNLVLFPYALALVLGLFQLRGVQYQPELWILTRQFVLALFGVAAVLLLLGALRGARVSRWPLERSRSRLLLAASLGLPFVFGSIYFGWGSGVPGGHLTPLLIGIALLTLPLGYAVTRYDLFDLTLNARRALDGILRVASIAALSASTAIVLHAGLGMTGPTLWAAAAVAGALLAEAIHTRLRQIVRHRFTLDAERRHRLLSEYEHRALELSTEEASSRLVGQALEVGLDCGGVAVFLKDGESWRSVFAARESPAFRKAFALAAADLLGERPYVHLARGDTPDTSEAVSLRDVGVELVIPICAEGETLGLILIGCPKTGRAFSSEEVSFARTLASHTATAIHNARLAGEQLARERKATLTRLARGVAHDLGSPLRVIERRLRRIADRATDPDRVRQETAKLEEVTKYLIRTVYDMASSPEYEQPDAQGSASVDEAIGRAVQTVDDSGSRVLLSLAPGLPHLRQPETLTRVLVNLLENALAAGDEGDAVWVYATCQSGELRIEVRDRGAGMDRHTLERAFDLFFTTRKSQGGTGIGLSIARELIDGVGGKIELDSTPGQGTTAVIRIPVGG